MCGRRVLAVLVIATSALLAACGADDEPQAGGTPAITPPQDIVAAIPGRPLFSEPQPPGTYVGTTGEDGRHSVALVVQRDVAVVYVCDGEKFGDFFAGPVEDDGFDLRSDKGTRIRGRPVREGVVGTLQLRGGDEIAYAAIPPSRARPRTGFFVFDDPGAAGFTARWIVTEQGMRGLSSKSSGRVVNGVTIRRVGTTRTDSRFAGVSGDLQKLNADVKQLQSELAAAREEDASLRDLLEEEQQRLEGKTGSGSTTTTTPTTTTTTTTTPTTAPPPTAPGATPPAQGR